jgi:glycerophosphoryl diester phosphodiesterase
MELLHFQPPVIAHRGASGYAPENTIAAFTKAAQLGIQWVEFDVMLAACGEAIVIHDENLNRTTNGFGMVDDYPYSYLRTLDAGAWFDTKFSSERIPTLSQVLEFIKNANMSANIEIKPLPGQDKKTVLQTLKEVALYYPQPSSSILFSSFSIDVLELLKKQAPTANIGLLMHDWLPDWQMICDDFQCISVHVNQDIISPEMAKNIKNTGRSLLCYSVNKPQRAKELYSWGVDAVFSDVPDIIVK